MPGLMLLSLSLMMTTTQNSLPASTPGVRPAPVVVATFDTLDEVNQLRAQRGLPPFVRDDTLMQVAAQRAQQCANMGRGAVHPGGSFAPARYEGVGNGHQFLTCYLYSQAGQYAGAATIDRNGQRYHVLLIR